MSTECRSMVSDFFFFFLVVFVVVLVVVVVRTNTMEERKRYAYESETTTATFFVLPISSYIHLYKITNKKNYPRICFFFQVHDGKNAHRKKKIEIYFCFFITDFSAEKKTSMLIGVFFRRHLSISANRRRLVRSDRDQQSKAKRHSWRPMDLLDGSLCLRRTAFFTHTSKMTINEFPFLDWCCLLFSTCSFFSLTNQSTPSSFSYWRTPSVFVCCLHCRQCSHTCSCQRRTEKKKCLSFVSVDFIRRLNHEWWINVSQSFSRLVVFTRWTFPPRRTQASPAPIVLKLKKFDEHLHPNVMLQHPSLVLLLRVALLDISSRLVDICHWRHSMMPCWEVRKVQQWTPALRRPV